MPVRCAAPCRAWGRPGRRLRGHRAGPPSGAPRRAWGPIFGRMRGPWQPAGTAPALLGGEVHVWWAELDGEPAAGERALSAGERERAQQIADPGRRRRWASGRAGLRAVLGAYLRCAPGEVELAAGPTGKPLPAGHGAGLHFSVSHSGGHALYAVALLEVGVDLELARPRERMRAIAARFLGPGELARIDALAPAEAGQALLRAWVRREAAVKCLGIGLAGVCGDHTGEVEHRIGGLWIASLPAPGDRPAQAALATARRPSAVRCLRAAPPMWGAAGDASGSG